MPSTQLPQPSPPDRPRASAIKAQIFRAKSLWPACPKLEPISLPTGHHEHGAWCRLKKSVRKHFHPAKNEALASESTTPQTDTIVPASCLHNKFKHDRCIRCLFPKSQCERLEAGFFCRPGGCIHCEQPSTPAVIDSEASSKSAEVKIQGGSPPVSTIPPQLPPIRPVSKVVDDMTMATLGTSLTDSKFSADTLDASSSTVTQTTRDTSISSLPSFDDDAAGASSSCPPPRNRLNRHAILPNAQQFAIIRMILGQVTEPQTAPTESLPHPSSPPAQPPRNNSYRNAPYDFPTG